MALSAKKPKLENFFSLRTVTWENGSVRMIDQTKLPTQLVFRSFRRYSDVADAIRTMVVRGAPAIGVAAAMAVALAACSSTAQRKEDMMKDLWTASALLRSTRPTAVNLFWGLDRMLQLAEKESTVSGIRGAVVAEAKKMEEEDVQANKKLGKIGAALIEDGDTVLTQCNAGALATVGYGTALGVVRAAKEQGKLVKVLVPETRPQLQGSRLTAYELAKDGIDCTIIPDTAVGAVISAGRVDLAIVGADRITKDGYVFNKIGTYQMAVLANRHSVSFYPVAPRSTFDLERTYDKVVIEERSYDEVVKIKGRRIAPRGVPVFNPAFDMTPPELITSIVSDRGLIKKPIPENIASVIA